MDFASLTPLEGGHSGLTFLARAGTERSVVRIYPPGSGRGERGHEIDAALLRLVRGLIPVPAVLEVRPGDQESGAPALLVTSFVEGVRADVLLPTLDRVGQGGLGAHVGRLLAALGGMPMPIGGEFTDGELRVRPFPASLDLAGWVSRHQDALGLSAGELEGLREVADGAQEVLDTAARTCLVHSDFNAKNLLVDPDTLAVAALVDWEYAHAGHPATDLGNALRFERQPAYADAVLGAYVAGRGGDPDSTLAVARAADLWALIELATRRAANPVAARAYELLAAIARAGDVHAVPRGR